MPVHAEPGPISLAEGILISGRIFILSSVKYGFSLYCLLTCSEVGRKDDFWLPTGQEILLRKMAGVKNINGATSKWESELSCTSYSSNLWKFKTGKNNQQHYIPNNGLQS